MESEEKDITTNKTPIQSWFLAVTKPKQEFRAIENLLNQNIDCFCPILKVEKIVKNKKLFVKEALFRGYIFIHISPQDSNWSKVRSTRGVRDWIRFSSQVAKIPTPLVDELKNLDVSGANILLNRINFGDSVKILSGPFEGLGGLYEKDDGDLRAIILIDFLGKSNRVKIEKTQLKVE